MGTKDVIVTTAMIPNRAAPELITSEMVALLLHQGKGAATLNIYIYIYMYKYGPALWAGPALKQTPRKNVEATMRKGSVIVDLAAQTGGNCVYTEPNKAVVTPNGVTVVGEASQKRRFPNLGVSGYHIGVLDTRCYKGILGSMA